MCKIPPLSSEAWCLVIYLFLSGMALTSDSADFGMSHAWAPHPPWFQPKEPAKMVLVFQISKELIISPEF